MENEIWRTIPGFSLYAASSTGRIKRTDNDRIISQGTDTKGYSNVRIKTDSGGFKTVTSHRLVAKAFLGLDGANRQVNHKDGNKKNNIVENLEWASHSENLSHAYRIGLRKPLDINGERHPMAKLTESDVLEIRRLAKSGVFRRDIAERFGIRKDYVTQITTRKKWKCVLAA